MIGKYSLNMLSRVEDDIGIGHGMCLLSDTNNVNDIKVVIFGGANVYGKPFTRGIVELSVCIKQTVEMGINDLNVGNFKQNVIITEKQINDIICDDSSFFCDRDGLFQFGYQLIKSSKNENIIAIIGGWNNFSGKNILLWNYNQRKITSIMKDKSDVAIIYNPSTADHTSSHENVKFLLRVAYDGVVKFCGWWLLVFKFLGDWL